jgi:hypothetical protein
MSTLNILLFVGAFLLALFTTIFAAGALVYLGGLVKEALHAMGWPRSAGAPQSRPARAAASSIPVETARDLRRAPALNLAGWLKPAAIGLGLLVVGFVAGTMSEHATSSLFTIAAPAAPIAAPAVSASESLPSADGRPAPAAGGSTGTAATAPRECSLERGIVTDCTFN